MRLEHNEIEFKYDAQKIRFGSFEQIMRKLALVHKMEIKDAESYDHYFVNEHGDFIRFRDSPDRPELTTKKKTQSHNNWNRIEVNLLLVPRESLKETVRAFCEALGFKHNFSIYKKCRMYFIGDINYVFYEVFDEAKVRRGQFVEVEYCEDKVSGKTEEQVLKILSRWEYHLKPLGIDSSKRLSKSLFEMFQVP